MNQGEVKNSTDLHTSSLIWDAHSCRPLNMKQLLAMIGKLCRCRYSGVNVVSINIGNSNYPLTDLIKCVAFIRLWLRGHSTEFVLVSHVQDIVTAKEEGKLAVTFDIEGGFAVEQQVSLIELFYKLGVKCMSLAYNVTNTLAGGCHDGTNPGLTAKGSEWINEMERVGTLVCCSHASYQSALDICEVASNPVLLSHSNALAIHSHPRNVSDDVMLAIAETGGIQCIN